MFYFVQRLQVFLSEVEAWKKKINFEMLILALEKNRVLQIYSNYVFGCNISIYMNVLCLLEKTNICL